ncbi:MAG: long-chain fatty acid--CoA ligase [Candidatus Aminicenantes bacterium]|nr:long-chain fatty acid--CoA ligase [Candidatus Aminicenantes bacterium]
MVETLCQIPGNTLRLYEKPGQLLYKESGTYVPISTREFYDRIRFISLGLGTLGFGPGDKLAILSENRPDWVMIDFAVLGAGGVTVPIYPTLTPEQIRYIIDDSEAKIVVCSTPELRAKIEAISPQLSRVRHFISLDPDASSLFLSFVTVVENGRKADAAEPAAFEKIAASVRPDDVASIIYTSGTTGVPKGVQLTHRNFFSNVKALDQVTDFHSGDTILSFLPLSHVLERMTTFSFLFKGATIGFAESIDTVAQNLLEVRPTIMVSVPRLFEKLYARIMDSILAGSAVKKKIFFWALGRGLAASRKAQARTEAVFPRNTPSLRLAQKLVFSKILEKTGGRVKFFVSGGAPLSRDIAEFFHAIGLVILEGYGLTETAPVVACNTFTKIKFGTVGPPVPGVEVKIAQDGEILVRGENVMKGYLKKESETAEALAGGWFHTGDIGFLDAGGFLTITDRKKDLIVTAGGKNVAPQPIENLVRQSPYIAQAVIVGASRKFISALIVPAFEKLEAYAKEKGIPYFSPAELCGRDDIQELILQEIERFTPSLASYEKVKKIVLLDRDFEIEQGELTPTLKVKRTQVERKYKDLIDALYKD